jgi:uncharacterized membrane protein
MVNVTTDIIINRPLQQVAAFVADPGNAPQWYVNIKSVEWKTPKPLQTGTQIVFTAQFLGRNLEYTYEVAEYNPRQKLVMRTAQGPFPMETTYTWQAIDANNTRMTLTNRGMPAGFSKLFTPFMSMAIRRANRKDLKRLKELLENSQTA